MTAPSPRSAKDIMVVDLVTLTAETDVFQGIDRLLANRVTGAPVIDRSGRYLGMFSEQCCMATLTEAARVSDVRNVRARHLMSTGLLTFDPDTDACDATRQLLHHRVSGAPVVDAAGCYLGSFSEKTCMRMLLDAIYEQRPVGAVAAHMDRSNERLIDENTDFNALAEIFLKTVLRRLPVIRDGVLIGQVSRRDVLKAAQVLRRGGSLQVVDPGRGPLVGDVMDLTARNVGPDEQLLSIVQIFGETWLRRLPVLGPGRMLLGQISRRDVLRTALALTETQPTREKAILYLSALLTKEEAPI
jgi:CBS-domain-containing membrane protein